MPTATRCLTDDELSAYLENRLGEFDLAAVRVHLTNCPLCLGLIAAVDCTNPSAESTKLSLNSREALGEPTKDSLGHPRSIAEYRVLSLLGRGSMGQVYLAQDDRLERRVAIKLLLESDAEAKKRFTIEARAIARLSHPNVVGIYRIGEEDGRPFLVSEYVRGKTLDQVPLPLPWTQALRIGTDLARGLAAAHRCGVLHRDIKPANAILATEEGGIAKLLDFGLAKLLVAGPLVMALRPNPEDSEPVPDLDVTLTRGLTQTGALVGTPRYMAPELWKGLAITAAADVYSLGALIFELSTGRPLHQATSLTELKKCVQTEAPTLLSLMPQVNQELSNVIARCLDCDPAKRYPSGESLLSSLEDLLQRTSDSQHRHLTEVAQRKAPTHPLARSGLLLAGLGASLLLLGVLPLVKPGLLGAILHTIFNGAPMRPDPQPELITRRWGNAAVGTVSPNGELLGYTEDSENLHIGYLRPLLQKDGKPRQFSDSRHSVSWISFSPDGHRLTYSAGRTPTDRQSEIYLVDLAANGSFTPPRPLVAGMTPSWFPDSKNIVFSNYSPTTGRNYLARISADRTSDAEVIVTDPPDDAEASPVISPDGRSMAFLRANPPGSIGIVPVEGGKLKSTLSLNADYPDRMMWTHDSRFLLYASQDRGLLAASADGKVGPTVLLGETYEAHSPSLSRSGDEMVYTRMPDRFDLRIADRDGKNPRSLVLPVNATQISWPLYSSDGHSIALGMTGPAGIRRVVIPGLMPKRTVLALGADSYPESFMDQDRALIVRNKSSHLEVVSLTERPPPVVLSFASNEVAAAVSPDGLRLATARTSEPGSPVANGIWVRNLHDPPERAVLWISDGLGRTSWSPDGRFLAAGTTGTALAIASGPGQVRRWPLRTADNKPLSTRNVRFAGQGKILLLNQPRVYEFDVHSEQIRPFLSYPGVAYIFGFSVSPDDRDVVFVAQEPTSDVWVLRDFKRLLESRLSGQAPRSL